MGGILIITQHEVIQTYVKIICSDTCQNGSPSVMHFSAVLQDETKSS